MSEDSGSGRVPVPSEVSRAQLEKIIHRAAELQFGRGEEYDTLDVAGSSADLGKPVGIDYAQGKMSVATIYSRDARAASDGSAVAVGDRVVEVLREAGALEYAQRKATTYAERAKHALQALADSEARTRLTRLADFAVSRDH